MRFRVLGCFGTIGNDHHTTSFLVDDDILIDAGSGLGTLPLEALSKIDHVFLSHAHMDHIALLPMLVDASLSQRGKPLVVHASRSTLETLSDHVFNWKVYPDFRNIHSGDHPALEFSVMEPDVPLDIGGRQISAIPIVHSIPTVAFHIRGDEGSLVVSTDMTVSDEFWPVVNEIDDLRYLLIESAFQNARRDLCEASGHLCPSLLYGELQRLKRAARILILHMKTSAESQIRKEIEEFADEFDIGFLAEGDILTI